jgi:hypothetical protein
MPLVTWELGGGATHIGIVVDRKTMFTRHYMIEHNIGAGPKIEDVLFDWKITGHYRYFGPVLGKAGDGPSREKPARSGPVALLSAEVRRAEIR